MARTETATPGMGGRLRRMTRQTLTYGLAPVLSRAVGFLLLPLYTRFLTPVDYGHLEIIALVAALLNILVGLEIRSALLRIYMAYDGEADRRQTVSTAVFLSVAVTALGALLIDALRHPIALFALGDEAAAPLLRLRLAALVAANASEVFYGYLLVRQQSTLYTSIWIAEFALTVVLNIALVAGAGLGVTGVLLGQLISIGAIAITLGGWTFRQVGFGFSVVKAREMLAFGLPLLGLSASVMVRTTADRVVLAAFGSVASVGLYSLAGRFSSALAMLAIVPFSLFWGVERFAVVKEEGGPRIIGRIFTYFFGGLCWMSLAVCVWSGPVVQIMTTREFWPAARVVPVLVLGQLLAGVADFFVTGALVKRRTGSIGLASVIIGVLHVGLCAALGWAFLAMGVAWANVATFALATVGAYAISHRYYPVPFEWDRLLKIAAVTLALLAAARWTPEEDALREFVVKAPFVVAYPVALVLLGFLDAEERGWLCRRIRRVLDRLQTAGGAR